VSEQVWLPAGIGGQLRTARACGAKASLAFDIGCRVCLNASREIAEIDSNPRGILQRKGARGRYVDKSGARQIISNRRQLQQRCLSCLSISCLSTTAAIISRTGSVRIARNSGLKEIDAAGLGWAKI
jgi:hypothetical protein